MTINGRIAILRQRLGLSQKTFGKLINRSEGYVSKVEGGKVAPTKEVIDAIITVFEVPEEWLKDGKGWLDVQGVGERIKRVRAERSLTQEQLAERLGCTRNTIGLIERSQVRAGEELLHTLCSELWVNENWLLTGKGSMERAELTGIYELLKKDEAVREAVKSFIAMLERPSWSTRKG